MGGDPPCQPVNAHVPPKSGAGEAVDLAARPPRAFVLVNPAGSRALENRLFTPGLRPSIRRIPALRELRGHGGGAPLAGSTAGGGEAAPNSLINRHKWRNPHGYWASAPFCLFDFSYKGGRRHDVAGRPKK